MEKVKIQGLKTTLNYLQSKQLELKRQEGNDTRSIESIIKYLKKDMIHRYGLAEYDLSIKADIKNTENFIVSVKKIISIHSESVSE
ncbi:hypothetical protein ACEN2I_06395 [Flavobacterium sp. W22_SRS_FK3]|uniref:hypothetical protein n=1 Tax=Flavobacterium sp. W22_SRS_FK3 TaxID=3240275 RepID=UPI003F91ED74